MDNLIRYRIYISDQIIGYLQVLKQKPRFRSICREAAFLKPVIKIRKILRCGLFPGLSNLPPGRFP